MVLLLAVPGLIGIFWGAPLVTRELEERTDRLVWNQSVTRTRWLAVKLTSSPCQRRGHRAVQPPADLERQPVRPARRRAVRGPDLRLAQHRPDRVRPFAFVLGTVVGMSRRTLPAMALTLACSPRCSSCPAAVRQHLMPPVTQTVASTPRS